MCSTGSFETNRNIPFLGGLRVVTFSMDNGLRLLVLPDHRAPVVAWQTWFQVGSAQESPGRTGMAHLFEHLMFKATRDYDDGYFSRALESIGADGLNAWTWLDETVFTQSVPVGGLELLAGLEASRMQGIRLTQEQLENERQVVINERRFRVDNDPEGQMAEKLWALAFQEHPYRWPTIGWLEDLRAITLEDCVAFYRKWYAPDNATIILVGDVEPEQAAGLISRTHGGMVPSHLPPHRLPQEPSQVERRVLELDLPVSTDRVLVGYKVPSWAHADIPALRVLSAVLSTGRTCRLERTFIDGGIAVSAGASLPVFRHQALYEVELVGRAGVPAQELLGTLDGELERLARDGITQAELERGLNQMRTQLWSGLSTGQGKASFLGMNLAAAGSWELGLERVHQLDAVSVEDVQRVVARYLVPGGSSVVLGRASNGNGSRTRWAPDVAESIVSEFPHLPPSLDAGSTPTYDVPQGETLKLDIHGATVFLARDSILPLLHVRLAFPFGSAQDPPGKEGLAGITARMMLRGTHGRSRTDFENSLEQIGAWLSASVGSDNTSFEGVVLAERWQQFAALLAEALSQPAFREHDVERLKTELLDSTREQREDDQRLATLAFREFLYGPHHPYGHDPSGTERGLERIVARDLREFHNRHVRARGAVLGLAGSVERVRQDELTRMLEPVKGAPPRLCVPPAPSMDDGLRVLLVDKPERSQTQVVGGHPGPSFSDADHAAFALGNQVFGGGSFSSRMMQQVREKRGWSYGAYSWSTARRGPGSWAWWVFPATEQTRDTIDLVLDLLRDLLARGLSNRELDQARDTLVNQAAFLVDTVSKRMGLELSRQLTGVNPLVLLESMRDLSREDVESCLRSRLDPGRMVIVVVGTAERLEGALEHLGPVRVLPYHRVGAGR